MARVGLGAMSAKPALIRVVAYGGVLVVAVGAALLVEQPNDPLDAQAVDPPSVAKQREDGVVHSSQAAVQAEPSLAFPGREAEVGAKPTVNSAVNEELAMELEPGAAADSASSESLMPIDAYLDADDPPPDYALADEALAVGEFLDADK